MPHLVHGGPGRAGGGEELGGIRAVLNHMQRTALQGSPDLLILGLGNSLFSRLLSDELLALLDRAPRRIGIFGTQYRDALPVDRLNAVLDRLDTWHARYEEDALIYGRGRSNVRHLGDWLIDAFPMATPAIDDMLEIRSTDVHGASLDRVISQIQMYKRVTSGRLHPLMCALTSAEAVAYDEQDEMGEGLSGKFRSMLIDVFGREPPPQQLWRVNRPAVVSYKQKVRAGVRTLTADIAQVLA